MKEFGMAAVSELAYQPLSPWRRRAKGFLGALQATPDEAPVAFPAPAVASMEMPVGDGGPAAPSQTLVDGVNYGAVGLPAIQDFWMRKAADGQDYKALARAYWDSHPELAAAGYGDWSPYKW